MTQRTTHIKCCTNNWKIGARVISRSSSTTTTTTTTSLAKCQRRHEESVEKYKTTNWERLALTRTNKQADLD